MSTATTNHTAVILMNKIWCENKITNVKQQQQRSENGRDEAMNTRCVRDVMWW